MVKVAWFYGFSRSKRLLLSTALTTALLLAFPAFAESRVAHHQRIIVFGDSLSAAYGLKEAQGWVALMAVQLKPRDIDVVNVSVSGETSSGGLSRIKAELLSQQPTLVLLALGANDGLRGLPVAAMQKNLDAVIAACHTAGANVVVIGMQIPPNYGATYTRQFNGVFANLAKQHKLPLVPFLLGGIADNLELFQADRLHPTAIAQPHILQNVMPAVELALKKTHKQKIKPEKVRL